MAQIINTAELDPSRLSTDEALWIYNGLDCCVTAEVFESLDATVDEVCRATYDFSKSLQGPVLEMNLRGLRINKRRRYEVLKEMRGKLTQLEANLETILAEGVGVPGLNWRSPTQLGKLFYNVLGLPAQKKRKGDGSYGATTDREAIERLSIYYIAEPICNHILACRDLGKSISFLETAADPDGRMRTNFNIAGTVTGRFSSEYTDFGTGCVRPTASALTPLGWRKLQDLKDGDIIAQYNEGKIEFVPANFYWTDFDGELFFINSEQLSLAVTPNHRVLSEDYRGNTVTKSAQETFENYAQRKIPLAGTYLGGTKTVPAYLAMLMADCSKEGTVWRAAWKKDKKISRFLKLMDQNNIQYKECKGRQGYARYTIYADITLPKKYGPWVLELTQESAKALIDEAKFWDAHIREKSFIFYTADKEEAGWFQTLCHLVGYSTTIKSQKNSKKAYGNQSVIYAVNVKPRKYAQVLRKHWRRIRYSGKVGCPQVPSSYWLVKENDVISITGNTNLQNVTESLRSVFVADPGMKFANLDLEQGDSRNIGALCWQMLDDWPDRLAGAYLDACESGDLHTLVTKMTVKDLPWGSAPDKQIAETLFYRHFTYRYTAKKLGHGSNYLGKPPELHKQSKIPLSNVKEFQRAYFDAFPCIPAFHEWVFRELERSRCLTTLFGRRRYFFGREREAETRRQAVAHMGQSMTSDNINTGILRLWRANRVQLMLQVHDSILIQYPEEMEDEIVPWALETLQVHLQLRGGRDFFIPTEAKTGWNWGDWSVHNPDGLMKWKGGDKRERAETDFRLSFQGI